MTLDPAKPATALLNALVAEFAASAPKRVYLATGRGTAWDCEHLSVSLVQVLPGTSDASARAGGLPSRQAGSMQIPRAVFEARILRCYPTFDNQGKPPTAEAIHAASQGLMLDAGRLLAGVYRWLASERQGVATVGQVDALGPEGALAGFATVVTYSPIPSA